jgi:aryl-alcohol dehydrogenase-like predicted oxidoreductase
MTITHSFLARKPLGKNGPSVSSIGLGCMGMSNFYGSADEAESLRTIRAALDAGINLLDTGDFYGMGHNEMLLRQVLKKRRDEAFVCVKFGGLRASDNSSECSTELLKKVIPDLEEDQMAVSLEESEDW